MTQWALAHHKQKGYGPAGTFEFWSGGSRGHGHIAVSHGLHNGRQMCVSTDIKRPGRFDVVPTAAIAIRWGLTHLGHSEDIDGVWVRGTL